MSTDIVLQCFLLEKWLLLEFRIRLLVSDRLPKTLYCFCVGRVCNVWVVKRVCLSDG